MEGIVSLEDIKEAYDYLHGNRLIVKTPLLKHVESLFDDAVCENDDDDGPPTKPVRLSDDVDLYLKMENMQTTGSFKIRGCCNQMRRFIDNENGSTQDSDTRKLITYSAGNYGKAFAHCVSKLDASAIVVMPDGVPRNRKAVIKSYGVKVKLVPKPDLIAEVDKFVSDGYQLCHSFDDIDLIAGNASVGLEILEEVPDPDIVLVCCGGGGLVSGVAASIALSGLDNKCRIYAVEPEGARTMHESFKRKEPVSMSVSTMAVGLAPPHAGAVCYKHCQRFVEDVLLVSDHEILSTMQILFHRGIKAELSGCAALAALLFHKVPDAAGKKIVAVVTGGNVTSLELAQLIPVL